MKYAIDPSGRAPAYLQLYRQLRDDIVREIYPFGAKLPSKRTIAEETGLSTVTVEHALALLSDEGYIEPRERSGCYVIFRRSDGFIPSPEATLAPGGSLAPDRNSFPRGSLAPDRNSSPGVNSSPGTSPAPGINSSPDANPSSGDSLPPGINSSPGASPSPGSPEFPFSVLVRTMRGVINAYGGSILDRSPHPGCRQLRAAISRYLKRSRGIFAGTEQIVIGAGAEYLYSLIVQLFGRDRVYGIESPSYPKIRQVYRAFGARCEELPLGSDGIESSALWKSRAGVLHLSPYRSFPSGVSASASKRHEYLRWASENGRFLVEDDFESEFSVLKKPEETLFSHAADRNVIYMNTFSRTISPSLRVGYMVLPLPLVPVFEETLGFYSCTVPTYIQYVLAELIESGDFERHINRVRRKKRKELNT